MHMTYRLLGQFLPSAGTQPETTLWNDMAQDERRPVSGRGVGAHLQCDKQSSLGAGKTKNIHLGLQQMEASVLVLVS